MDRLTKFNTVSDQTQTLLLKIYGNLNEYLSTLDVSPLEDYIFSFDKSMEHQGIIQSIGERIGIMLAIKYDFGTTVDFYWILSDILDRKAQDPQIGVIMNMTQPEFYKYLISIGRSEYQDEYVYLDRLHIFAYDFNIKFMQGYLKLE